MTRGTQELFWLNEAFSKEYVDELEAACCLTEGQRNVYFGYDVSSSFVDYDVDPKLRSNYRIMTTWGLRRRSLLQFIDRAISINLQNLRRDFLLKKCKELFFNLSPKDQEDFVSNYYYISRELGIAEDDTDEDSNGSSVEVKDNEKYPWVPFAKKIYFELQLEKSDLSMERRAMKVAVEMENRLLAGDKNMAKRGGKKAPSDAAIRRHALQNLE